MNSLTIASIVLSLCALSQSQIPVCRPGDEWLPDEDCTKYYVCSNGMPIEQNCPDGLYWNNEGGFCDFAVNVPECEGGTRPPGGGPTGTVTATTPSATTPPNATTPAPTTTAGTTDSPGECPATGIVRIPNPDFCEKYYLCVEGIKIDATCSAGLYFDVTIGDCYYAEEVNCGTRATPEPPETSTDPTTGPTAPTTTAATTAPSTGAPDQCPATGVTRLPDPSVCDKYFLCVDGLKIPSTCAPGLYFDAVIGDCNVADQVDCGSRPTPGPPGTDPTVTATVTTPTTTTGTGGPVPTCPAEGVVYLPFPGDCTIYLICVEGSGSLYRCPEGTSFDIIDLYCKVTSEARCSE